MSSSKSKPHNYAGFHYFQDENNEPYGSFEVFWSDYHLARGWYWWACFPGCLPDNEMSGPFETAELAYENAMEDNKK